MSFAVLTENRGSVCPSVPSKAQAQLLAKSILLYSQISPDRSSAALAVLK